MSVLEAIKARRRPARRYDVKDTYKTSYRRRQWAARRLRAGLQTMIVIKPQFFIVCILRPLMEHGEGYLKIEEGKKWNLILYLNLRNITQNATHIASRRMHEELKPTTISCEAA